MRTYITTSVHIQRHLLLRLEMLDSIQMPYGMPDSFFSELKIEGPLDNIDG